MKSFSGAKTFSTLFLAITSALTASSSFADELETIEVVGKRQAYRGNFYTLQAPESSFELNSAVLENSAAEGLIQALDLSASVSRQNSLGGLWDSFAIRGFFGDEDVPSGYLVNGFNAGRGFSGPRDIAGIERIEILKGPKAALFGRGEPGGAVNLITKKPSFETQGEINFTAGSRQKRRVDADYTGAISDNVAARVIGFKESYDSFRDTLEIDKHGFMGSLYYQQSERSVWQYELEYAEQEIPFDRGIIAPNGDFDFMPIERFLGEPGDGPTTTHVVGHQIQWQYDLTDTWRIQSGLGFRQTELDSFSSDADVSPSRQKLFYDGQTLTRQRRERAYDTDQYVARFELAGEFDTGSIEHSVLVGADYDRFEFSNDYKVYRAPKLTTMPTDEQLYAINIHSPIYGQWILPTPVPQLFRQQNQWATGIYFQDQMQLSDKLHLRVGGRYDWLKQTTDDKLRNRISRQDESHFSPQAGIVYQFTDAVSLYSTYGEGYRLNFGTDHKGEGFDPNQSESVEVGTKWALMDGGLNITLAYFDTEQTNILVLDPVNLGAAAAIGEASSQGIELDVVGQLPADIQIWFSYAYTDAQVDKDAKDTGLWVDIKKGDKLLNVPEQAANLQLSQAYDLAGKPLSIGGGINFVDERLGQRGTDFQLPSYTLVNLFAEYQVLEQLVLKAQVRNLFDRKHFTNSYTQMWVQPGEPRHVQVSASYRF